MKLDRNITNPRRGKYALIKLRECTVKRCTIAPNEADEPTMLLVPESSVDFGDSVQNDFFVIRLKDQYAAAALKAYADAARRDDAEYAAEIYRLAELAEAHPNKRRPD